jgi:hypothetical protein
MPSNGSSSFYLLATPSQAELGAIQYAYQDDLEGAEQESSETGWPVLCVQAEVPGDQEAGLNVLSHPLIVEAAESLFVTVSVTLDSDTLATRYRPSPGRKPWCTTLKILDPNPSSTGEEELVPEIGGDLLTVGLVAETMIKALKLNQKTVPQYLELLCEEETGRKYLMPSGVIKSVDRVAVLAVADCHEAEVDFAGLEGVLRTQAGIYQGQRVIQVHYASRKVTYGSLLQFAISLDNVQAIYFQSIDERVAAQMEIGKLVEGANPPPSLIKLDLEDQQIKPIHDPKSALRKTEMRYVPLTDLQTTRMNRLIHQGNFHKATHLLSPRQGIILMKSFSNVSQRKLAIDVPIIKAWKALKDNNSSELVCHSECP